MVIGNSHYAVRSKAPIDANSAMNVIGHDAQPHLPIPRHRETIVWTYRRSENEDGAGSHNGENSDKNSTGPHAARRYRNQW
jgi:hypothetical protein